MDALVASAIAVLGTLSGAALTQLFQYKLARRADQRSLAKERRQELLAAISSFSEVVTDYRTFQYRRWRQDRSGTRDRETPEVKAESDRYRSAARRAWFLMRLHANDAELCRLADRAVDTTWEIGHADDEATLQDRHAAARQALEDFVDHAAAHLR
ncbi:MAG: hypothetical protein ACRDTQ_11800 [Micromonosporaceae bacterium]